jgi:hypothetical protein
MSNLTEWVMKTVPSEHLNKVMVVIIDALSTTILPNVKVVAKRFEPNLKLNFKTSADFDPDKKSIVCFINVIFNIPIAGEAEVGRSIIYINKSGFDVLGRLEIDCSDNRIRSIELHYLREAIGIISNYLEVQLKEYWGKIEQQITTEQQMAQNGTQYNTNLEKNPNYTQQIPPTFQNRQAVKANQISQPVLALQSQIQKNSVHPNVLSQINNQNFSIDQIQKALARNQNGIPKNLQNINTTPQHNIQQNSSHQNVPQEKQKLIDSEKVAMIKPRDLAQSDEFPKPDIPKRKFNIRIPTENSLRSPNIKQKKI